MKYIGIILLIVVGLSVNASWANFKQFVRPVADNVTVTNKVNKLLAETKYSQQDERVIAMTIDHVKKLQTHEQQHRRMYENLVGIPYKEAIVAVNPAAVSAKASSRSKANLVNKYVVSMVFITSTDRYAVVGGRFIHEGDILKGKDTVKLIEAGQITVLQNGKLNTVAVSGAKL